MKGLRLILLLCSVLYGQMVFAQTGKLSGKVTDASGVTLIGVTVALPGTQLGAVTDTEGYFAILRIPPGTYSVRFSYIGYQALIISGVRVNSNQTTTQNATLREETLQGGEVTVVAERPIVDVSQTSSMTSLSKEDIAVLPVQNIGEIVNLQAGVVDGHFRGGRQGEVQYQVDGVSVNNPYNNSSSLELDRSLLQEVQVISGTFDAEYGQAMSGVVNAVLRSGDLDRFEVNLETFGGSYYSTAENAYTKANRFPHLDKISPLNQRNLQASVSGPFIRNTTFLVSGQHLANDGYLFGERRFLPSDRSDLEQRTFNPTGDGAVVPMNFSYESNLLAKVSNRSLKNIKLEYQAITNWIKRKYYNDAWRLNPEGVKTPRQFSIVHGLNITHTLSDKRFYELTFRQNRFDYKDMLFEDLENPLYLDWGRPQSDSNYEDGAVVQGADLGRFIQTTDALVAKGAYTDQITKAHLLKLGFEFMRSNISFGAPGIIAETNVGGVQVLLPRTDLPEAKTTDFSPIQGSIFAQDRVEWGDLRIRGGVRLEYFDARTTVPSELRNPANAITGAPASTPKATTVKLALAPRLGISFPILDRASVFFSYGHFYQMPGLGQLFQNADYSVLKDLQAGGISYGVMGNPDLKPEFTTQYEFGFKSALNRDLGLDLSLFYKDIRDLLGVEFVQTFTAAEYARLTNVDFGGVRGFTLSLDQRTASGLNASVDYTLQIAVGNSSDPRETANRAAAGEDPRPRQVAFNWDQRHTLNGSLTWFKANNFNLTTILRFGSGQPFTPELGSTFGSDLEPNSGRKANFFLLDVRAEKYFKLGKWNATGFVRAFNLTDEHAVNGFVFANTGSPYYSLTPEANRSQLRNPGRFSQPRRIEVGLTLRGVFKKG
ncbi:MAG: TonB-dependent receptor [Rhodothermia bacterium]|nr:TonB-dependent receptor [Rhodothermia bacterium]